MAFLRCPGLAIQIDGVIGAGMGAGGATNAQIPIKVDDGIGPLMQRHDRADLHAGRVIAVIAAQHGEVTTDIGEGALLRVLHPGSEVAQRDVILRLAGHCAGMAADALPMINDKSVLWQGQLLSSVPHIDHEPDPRQ